MIAKNYFKNIFNILIFMLIEITLSLKIYEEEKLLLPNTKLFDVGNGCREIRIPINYKKLMLKIKSKNINRLLVTDMRINSCNQAWDIKACCSKNSTFCMENSNPTKNEFNLNYCIDQTFIYACYSPEDPSNNLTKIIDDDREDNNIPIDNNKSNSTISDESNTTLNDNSTEKRLLLTEENKLEENIIRNIHINASIIKGEGCTTAEYLPETECSTLGLLNCLDQTKCNKACTFVECRKTQNDKKSKVFSMCLPKDLEDSEIQDRCSNHVAFKDKVPQIIKVPCTNQKDLNFQEKNSSHTFFKFLLVLFGLFVLIIFISSVFFRYHLSNYKEEPFSPPSFVPNFIYPRLNVY